MSLTPNFTMRELTRSATATRFGYYNEPDMQTTAKLLRLTVEVLQPLRDALGAPITVTSGYRGPRLNDHVGGAPSSAHLLGVAADIDSNEVTPAVLAELARTTPAVQYGRILLEYPPDGWVHIESRYPDRAHLPPLMVKKSGEAWRAVETFEEWIS